ncbi:MAG: AI-2E family transporter YdiK [Burkholderiales bacterium]|nr:AI-2E family transporter YdiK [Burkholderiales bacterium]MDE2397669.1 AI-2E family transporter YdiK [Burkholderiales bacterium]
MKTSELASSTLAVLVIGLLIGASLWILRPFLGSAIWAAMVVVATWPVLLRLQRRFGGRRWIAVALMTLLLLLVFAVPLVMALLTIAGNSARIVDWARDLSSLHLGTQVPQWLARLPFVGAKAAAAWQDLVAAGFDGIVARVQPYAGNVTKWIVGEVGGIGFVLVQFLLTVAISAVMYLNGEAAADRVLRFARRLGGERGVEMVRLAGDAIRGVALGVGVTALVQALLGGIGLALAGVPVAGLLTAVMFMLCIAQIGALPVLVPATIWVFWNGDTGWGIFLAVWSTVVGTLDNFLRPVLIRMGADLPLLLIFAGVIGGLLAFGLLGIFVGPVLLAVSYTLLESWLDETDASGS